jgi:hypothetical protein
VQIRLNGRATKAIPGIQTEIRAIKERTKGDKNSELDTVQSEIIKRKNNQNLVCPPLASRRAVKRCGMVEIRTWTS